MTAALIALDLLLTAGMAMRLTRFIVTDDLGGWLIRHPVHRALNRQPNRNVEYTQRDVYYGNLLERVTWREKLDRLFHCPWCIGFWIDCAVIASLWAVGGPGDAAEWWRWLCAPFTLNYIAAHIGARLGDTDGDD